ncbi:hypothetical protein EMIHUDRAFT_102411 [Emiliania huxleyi CCMP1516]|uniref:Uncharacterized protein n=2 Tax=Emiliania huxleyi TaxID=2903 RepID=A0A0D3J2G0_EMIH1|nr:hypothetical protein EMIHUDRAFT_102411 [Emiliania huxleyi CCMP1516]EOD17695.1 hypothetical protein EMIHUDRAFT_102411 [Emiliania huxleyi CCMP1516]|eukprot:XP_005770124.1 hypothetical protein EMIHUDRAFT_102411 [Emiliania huxleyi CCMP1516]
MHAHASWYALQLSAVLLWWALIKRMTGKHLYSLCSSSVITRPSWLSREALTLLVSHKRQIFLALPAALAAGAFAGQHALVRLLVALVVSLYHLSESSHTNRHGEYPVLYTAWAMVLPASFAHAASMGVAIHFVLSCGIAKCMVGGPRAWVFGGTMRTYLEVYGQSTSSKPLVRGLNRLLARRASTMIGASTLLLECVAVPLTLLLPGVWGMVGLHVGIALAMSLNVGLVFLTTLPTYVHGFSCDARVGSAEWRASPRAAQARKVLGLMRGGMGSKAERIARLTMTGRTRLVLATREAAQQDLVGTRSGAFGAKDAPAGHAVHDSILRATGFTLLHDNLVDAFDLPADAARVADGGAAPAAKDAAAREAAELEMMRRLLMRLERWLARERRLLEASSARPLERAYFVLLDGDKTRVAKVLADAA